MPGHRDTVRVCAPAKLNLHLGIYPGRDERGYHRADSVMIGLALHDVVQLSPADHLCLTSSVDCGIAPERNTAYRAARSLCEAFGKAACYAIHLEKHIPAQAGLGGASADAAAVLVGLCRLWGIDATDERVVAVARAIGADVPFFLTMAPALMTGAGDVLEETFPVLPDVPVVLVLPDVGVSTVEAYREFDAQPTEPASPEGLCAALRAGDAGAVAELLYNNLEPAANRLVPETARVRRWLERQPGVRGAQLTGSGSCVFALCASEGAAERIAWDAHVQGAQKWQAICTKTLGAGSRFC